MSTLGKRTNKVREGIDREKLYPLNEAVKMVKERAKAKFDETIEVAMNWASIRATPTRRCVASSTCRTAPAARCGLRCSRAAPRPMRLGLRAPTSLAPRIW